jgi:peroxiredoxin
MVMEGFLAFGPCLFGAALLLLAPPLYAQKQIAAIDFQMPNLSKLSGNKRTRAIRQLAMTIRRMPANADAVKVVLACELADAAADGAVGRDTLQEVTTTLSQALREFPSQSDPASDPAYLELARLVRYEHMQASPGDPRIAAAMATLEAEDRDIQQAEFTLADLSGKTWTLKDLRGKVVLINFWEAGCLPCVKEIPALNEVYNRFRKQGLVVLAISADDASAIQRFLAAHAVSYPVLLDSGSTVSERFHVVAIPRSLVYDRAGTVVAQTIGERTQMQFEEMLGRAGLH